MRKIWAIARVTLAQGVRMKVPLVIVLFLVVLVATLPFMLEAASPAGKVKLAASYSLYVLMFLTSVLALFLSATTISKEIEDKQIFVLDPKPAARWQVFVGKWIGVMILNTVLLLVLGGVSYGLVRYRIRSASAESPQQAAEIRSFLTTHESAMPTYDDIDIDAMAEEKYREWTEKGHLTEGRSKKWALEKMRAIVQREVNSVSPLVQKTWRIEGLPRDLPEGTLLELRFRFFSTAFTSEGRVRGGWEFINPTEQRGLRMPPDEYSPEDFHTVEVPAEVIGDDGTAIVRYTNLHIGGPMVIFPFEDGVALRYPTSTLFVNYARAMVTILAMLGTFSVVGLACGACLSFPVAILLALVVFMVGLGAGFLDGMIQKELYLFGHDIRTPEAESKLGDEVIKATCRTVLAAFPPILKYSPVSHLADAELVPDSVMGGGILKLLLLRGGIIGMIGGFLFHRRELGTAATR